MVMSAIFSRKGMSRRHTTRKNRPRHTVFVCLFADTQNPPAHHIMPPKKKKKGGGTTMPAAAPAASADDIDDDFDDDEASYPIMSKRGFLAKARADDAARANAAASKAGTTAAAAAVAIAGATAAAGVATAGTNAAGVANNERYFGASGAATTRHPSHCSSSVVYISVKSRTCECYGEEISGAGDSVSTHSAGGCSGGREGGGGEGGV